MKHPQHRSDEEDGCGNEPEDGLLRSERDVEASAVAILARNDFEAIAVGGHASEAATDGRSAFSFSFWRACVSVARVQNKGRGSG